MKSIIKIITIALVFTTLESCTTDKDPVISTNGFQLRSDATVVPPTVFSESNKDQVFSKLNWDRSNYGPATVPTYVVVISDRDAVEKQYVELPAAVLNLEPDARKAELKVDDLNTAMNSLSTFKCGEMNIDISIKSKLGSFSNAVFQYSNPISVSVTGYPKTPLALALVKDSGNPNAADKLLTSSFATNSDYEGYAYLEPGSYKLYQPNACGDYTSPTIYGLNAGSVVSGGTDTFNVATAGHYLIKVNLSSAANSDTGVAAMSYSIAPFTSFGIFGAAKGIPLGANRPMTYNTNTKKWELTIELFKGRKFRFRAVNGSTNVVLLGLLSGTSLVEYPLSSATAGDIRVPGTDDGTKQNYIIKLDTSNPRNYSFELTAN